MCPASSSTSWFRKGVTALACIAAAVSLAASVSCGYHLARKGERLPGGIKRIAIPVFKNETYEAGIEDVLTDALIAEFLNSRWVTLSSVEDSDAKIMGVVKDFVTSPIAFRASEFAVEYRARIKCKIQLRDRDGKVLWEDETLSESEEYEVTVDIFQSEANKARAVERLARNLMEEVHDRIFDGF